MTQRTTPDSPGATVSDLQATPLRSYVFGDVESCALTIDVFSKYDEWPPYQARIWEDGDTSDLEYFETWRECIDWFSQSEAPWGHEGPDGKPLPIVGLAPQSSDLGKTVFWRFIDATHVDSWWMGSDFPDGHIDGKRIILLPEIAAFLEQSESNFT